jgi:hypothetical protein
VEAFDLTLMKDLKQLEGGKTLLESGVEESSFNSVSYLFLLQTVKG